MQVIVEKVPKSSIPDIDKKKFLVPADLSGKKVCVSHTPLPSPSNFISVHFPVHLHVVHCIVHVQIVHVHYVQCSMLYIVVHDYNVHVHVHLRMCTCTYLHMYMYNIMRVYSCRPCTSTCMYTPTYMYTFSITCAVNPPL